MTCCKMNHNCLETTGKPFPLNMYCYIINLQHLLWRMKINVAYRSDHELSGLGMKDEWNEIMVGSLLKFVSILGSCEVGLYICFLT